MAIVTPASIVSAWTVNTLEALPIAKRIAQLGIKVMTYTGVTGFGDGKARLANKLTGEVSKIPAAALVTITARIAHRRTARAVARSVAEAGITSLTRIGDCWAPSTIQQAVYTGHKWARELDEAPEVLIPRELPMIESGRVPMT